MCISRHQATCYTQIYIHPSIATVILNTSNTSHKVFFRYQMLHDNLIRWNQNDWKRIYWTSEEKKLMWIVDFCHRLIAATLTKRKKEQAVEKKFDNFGRRHVAPYNIKPNVCACSVVFIFCRSSCKRNARYEISRDDKFAVSLSFLPKSNRYDFSIGVRACGEIKVRW